MITELTRDQKNNLAFYTTKWTARVLSTDTLDLEVVQETIARCYELAELAPPERQLQVVGSPMDPVTIESLRTDNSGNILYQVSDAVRRKVDIALLNRVHKDVLAEIREEVEKKVSGGKLEAIRSTILSHTGGEFDDQLFGAHESNWLAVYDFILQDLEIEECSILQGLMDLAQHCGWWIPFEDFALVQDKPNVLRFDEHDQLHSDTGPAISYRNGFKIYVWHGVIIPEAWIEDKESLTVEMLFTWDDLPQRYALDQILDWDTILQADEHTVIDEDENPDIGMLFSMDLGDNTGIKKFLKHRGEANKTVVVPVDDSLLFAVEAHLWKYGVV
jgi:hypothetical protein